MAVYGGQVEPLAQLVFEKLHPFHKEFDLSVLGKSSVSGHLYLSPFELRQALM
jgi:hypothetical protein